MKIIQITPGSGDNFYCENCLRDGWLVHALRRMGHDAAIAPMYLPVTLDLQSGQTNPQLFFGGINVYLQEHFPIFRRTPRWLDRTLDHPALLRLLARHARTTRAADLGALTVSMLAGEQGRQAKELDRLVQWLEQEKPDAIILSNALLLGLARRIKQACPVPLLCLLQDEDSWIDVIPEPHRHQAWGILADRARAIDAFGAVSRFYADAMCIRLDIPGERMHVVYPGIPLDGYQPDFPRRELAIGYLGRMMPALGLDILIDAFTELRRHGQGTRPVRLILAGGQTADDTPFLRELQARIRRAGLAGEVSILPELHRAARTAFLRQLTLLSVPARIPVAFGIFILEALASGVPVVLPRIGAFPEVLAATGGGLLYEPNVPASLAAALESLLQDSNRRNALAHAGCHAVQTHFDIGRMAADLISIINRLQDKGLERPTET